MGTWIGVLFLGLKYGESHRREASIEGQLYLFYCFYNNKYSFDSKFEHIFYQNREIMVAGSQGSQLLCTPSWEDESGLQVALSFSVILGLLGPWNDDVHTLNESSHIN